MQDKSINNALLALRKQIIRGDLDGLDHVEALLRIRGVAVPPPRPVRLNVAKRSHMAWLVLAALRHGPKDCYAISAYVAQRRPELDYEAAHSRSKQATTKLRAKGAIRREGRVWIRTLADRQDLPA